MIGKIVYILLLPGFKYFDLLDAVSSKMLYFFVLVFAVGLYATLKLVNIYYPEYVDMVALFVCVYIMCCGCTIDWYERNMKP